MTKETEQNFSNNSLPNQAEDNFLYKDYERIVEAAIFASDSPITEEKLSEILPTNTDISFILNSLVRQYADRGINLQQNEYGWYYITCQKVGSLIKHLVVKKKTLTRASLETLAVIAWHQPVTRTEIETIRGVAMSSSSLDSLMEANFVKQLGRRLTVNNPLEWGTTAYFLQTFGLQTLQDLPGIEELRKSGFMPDISKESSNPILSNTSENPASLLDSMKKKLDSYNTSQ